MPKLESSQSREIKINATCRVIDLLQDEEGKDERRHESCDGGELDLGDNLISQDDSLAGPHQ